MGVHMTKVPEYPLPHEFSYGWAHSLEVSTDRKSTIMPIVCYDEGLGAMSSKKTNPQATGFAEVASANCYPTSKINKVWAQLTVSMSKEAIQTDKIPSIRFATYTIHTAFMDGELALDEISTLDLNEILELQNEQTNRSTFPLYNAVDMFDYKTNAKLDMPADQDGLDTDLEIEAVSWGIDDYHDCLHYYTNGAKLRTICTGLQWHTLTPNHPYKNIYFNQQSNTKYMNPYALLAGFIHVPPNNDVDQTGKVGDTTVDTNHVECQMHVRYNEFNHEFNHSIQ